MSSPQDGSSPFNAATEPRPPSTPPRPEAPRAIAPRPLAPPPPPSYRSFIEPLAVQQRRRSITGIPEIFINPPTPHFRARRSFTRSLQLNPAEIPQEHRRCESEGNLRATNAPAVDEMQRHERAHAQHPSVLDPRPPKATLSYSDAIDFFKNEIDPLIAGMKIVPDRKVTIIVYDPAGSSIYVTDYTIRIEADVGSLITWFQMFVDAFVAQNNYKDSLLVHSVQIRYGAIEEKVQLPMLVGRPWDEKIGGIDAAAWVEWQTGGSQLESYWTAYRTVMHMLGSAQNPMFKIFTIRFCSPDKTIGRFDAKESGSGHYFKGVEGLLAASEIFRVVEPEALDLGPTRTQAIIDGQVTPSSSYRSTSLTFDNKLPKGKRLSFTDRVPSGESLNANKSSTVGQGSPKTPPRENTTKLPVYGPPPSEIPLSEECVKLSQKGPGKWNPFHLNGKTGYAWTPDRPPFNTGGDPKNSWDYYQKLGGDPLNHVAFSFAHVPFEESSFKFADSLAISHQSISNTLKTLDTPTPPELKDPMYADKLCIIEDEDEMAADGTAAKSDSGEATGAKGKEKQAVVLSAKELRIKAYLEQKERALGFEDDDVFFPDPSIRDAPAPAPVVSKYLQNMKRGHPAQGRNSLAIGLQEKFLKMGVQTSQHRPSTPPIRPTAVGGLAVSAAATTKAKTSDLRRSPSDVSNASSKSSLNVKAPSFETPGLNVNARSFNSPGLGSNAGGQSSHAAGYPQQPKPSYQDQSGSDTSSSSIGGFEFTARPFHGAKQAAERKAREAAAKEIADREAAEAAAKDAPIQEHTGVRGESMSNFSSFADFNKAHTKTHAHTQSGSSSTSTQKKCDTGIPSSSFGNQGFSGGGKGYDYQQDEIPILSLSTPYSPELFTTSIHQRTRTSRFFPAGNGTQNLGGNNMAGGNPAGGMAGNMAGNNMAGNNMAGNNMAGNNMAGNNMARENMAGGNMTGNMTGNIGGGNMGGGNMAGNMAGNNTGGGMSGNTMNTTNPFYQGNMGMSGNTVCPLSPYMQGNMGMGMGIGGSQQYGYRMGVPQYGGGGGNFSNNNQGYPPFGQQLDQARNLYSSGFGNTSATQGFIPSHNYYSAGPAFASGSGGSGLESPFAQLGLASPFAHQTPGHGHPRHPPGLNNPYAAQQGQDDQQGGGSNSTPFPFYPAQGGGHGAGGNGGL